MRKLIAVAFIAAALGGQALGGCPTYANCPMHGQNSNMTGHTKYANGHQWAEFICRSESVSHTFWIQCD